VVNNFTNVNKANKHLSSEEKIKGEKKDQDMKLEARFWFWDRHNNVGGSTS
jgi:hypothetical protein